MKRKTPKDDMREEHLERMRKRAKEYPNEWFNMMDCASILGFGRDVMSALAAIESAPIVFRKSNPHELHKWIVQNMVTLRQLKTRT